MVSGVTLYYEVFQLYFCTVPLFMLLNSFMMVCRALTVLRGLSNFISIKIYYDNSVYE